ncbi:MAG: deoxyhypusine synthase-like protein [Candidatus Tectimicrobiota bacterium]|nr:MAG: deoxyhypusine synthase-like protein [Candidatus Tectomicrobia bacterium]
MQSFADLLRAMRQTAFGGRQLGEAFEVLQAMVSDPDCLVVATVSGAMTVAKMGTLLCRLIDHGMIHVLVATGALITHGLTESVGLVHYRCPAGVSDRELYAKGYNRVYDTLEMEANLYDVEPLVHRALSQLDPAQPWSSLRITRALGRILHEEFPGEGILKSAYRRGVPVFIPAFTDSELGLDLSFWAMRRALAASEGRLPAADPYATVEELLTHLPPFNPFEDLHSYARCLLRAPRTGIFTIGGGVPRNWAQQVGSYIEFMSERLDLPLRVPRFCYGVRLCPEPAYWGGLSGSTYAEGVSWGKFVAPEDGGRYAEVYADATLVLPLLVKALLEACPTVPPPPLTFPFPA